MSHSSFTGFDAAPSENTIVPPGKDICLLCDYSNQIFNEKWRDENAVDVPTSSCSCTAMINGTGNSLCIQNFRNTTFYDCYVPIGTFSSCCTRAHLTLAGTYHVCPEPPTTKCKILDNSFFFEAISVFLCFALNKIASNLMHILFFPITILTVLDKFYVRISEVVGYGM